MKWYLDASTCTLYHQVEEVWTYHDVANIGRLRFQVEAHARDAPTQYSHVVEVCVRMIYMEIANKYKIKETQKDVIEHVIEYTSGSGDTSHTLPRHIQRLVGNIPELDVPNGMDVTVDQDIIVSTDGYVVFGVGYHSWVVTTEKEHVLLRGGVLMMETNS
jgi:hypothetical protein